MAKLLTIDHDNDWADWGGSLPGAWIYTAPTYASELAASQAAFTIRESPGKGNVLYCDGRANPTASNRPLFGPMIMFPGGPVSEVYGTFSIRVIGLNHAGSFEGTNVSFAFIDNVRTITPTAPFNNLYSPRGQYNLRAQTDLPNAETWLFEADNGNWATGAGDEAGFWWWNGTEADNIHNMNHIPLPGQWTDIHFKLEMGEYGSKFTLYNATGESCDDTFVSDTLEDTMAGEKNPIAGFTIYANGLECEIGNIGFTDDSGSAFSGPTCGMADLFGGFSGTDGATVYPAPEALPHRITLDDVGGKLALQKKLNDNFDTIERQLLALDPDNQDNPNPFR